MSFTKAFTVPFYLCGNLHRRKSATKQLSCSIIVIKCWITLWCGKKTTSLVGGFLSQTQALSILRHTYCGNIPPSSMGPIAMGAGCTLVLAECGSSIFCWATLNEQVKLKNWFRSTDKLLPGDDPSASVCVCVCVSCEDRPSATPGLEGLLHSVYSPPLPLLWAPPLLRAILWATWGMGNEECLVPLHVATN